MPELKKLADLLVNYSVAVQQGDKVLVQGGYSSSTVINSSICQGIAGRWQSINNDST